MPLPPKAQRVPQVLEWLRAAYPAAQTELHYADPYQLIVAVILSAQCTDVRVNLTTPAIFARYPTVHYLARATPDEVFPLIKSISYPNNKAKHLVGMAQRVVQEYNGEIPGTMEALTSLPGVGRKTANVVLSVAYDQPALAVDTHVFRVANRLGLTRARTPRQSEDQLMKWIRREDLATAHHWLILHGRYVCKARTPDCPHCGLLPLCPHGQKLHKPSRTELPDSEASAGS
jgi:endonuclease III